MNILVLNCGSSTLKFQLIATDLDRIQQNADHRIARGVIERIGSESLIALETESSRPVRQAKPLRDHYAALDFALRWILSKDSGIPSIQSLADIHAVGHRVVHG